jgi:hypothetical protein
MDEWVAFLKARLDEEEPPEICGCLDVNHWPPCTPQPAAERKRREIKAMREILAMAEEQAGRELPEGVHDGRDPDERERDEDLAAMLGEVVRIHAGIWDGHPAYPGR